MEKYFVKFIEPSPEFYELIKKRSSAFVLLAIIVNRARKAQLTIDDGIEIGEAQIGDYKIYGATEQSYRTDKKLLTNLKIITTRTTSKGTIAKVVNSSIFDISRVSSTNKLTDQQQANNMQATTKQEVRSEKEERGASQAIEKNSFFQDRPLSSSHETSQSGNAIEEQPSAYRSNNSNGRSVPTQKIGKEDYWDINAPRIAGEMGISEESWQFINGKKDWLKKGHMRTSNSIEEFLSNANDWEEPDKGQRY